MIVKVYVGNLSYKTTEDDLRALFSEVGTVASVSLIKDRGTGNSKGFAFVEMTTQVEAEAAIGRFNGFMMSGQCLNSVFTPCGVLLVQSLSCAMTFSIVDCRKKRLRALFVMQGTSSE